jgi:hypothetical protein
VRLHPLWFIAPLVILSACGGPAAPPPDPTAVESVIQAAVAATATALAAERPTVAPVASTASPTTAPSASPTSAPPTAEATTAPATRPPVVGTPNRLTSDEAAYVRSVIQVIREFNRSFDRFSELLNQPNPEDASWRLALNAELTLWGSSATLARNVQAPASFASVHQRVLTGLGLYEQASNQITQAFESGNNELMNQGLQSAVQARQSFAEAEGELTRIARERNL